MYSKCSILSQSLERGNETLYLYIAVFFYRRLIAGIGLSIVRLRFFDFILTISANLCTNAQGLKMFNRALDFGAFVLGQCVGIVEVIGAFGFDDKIQFFISRDGVYAASL